MATIDYYQAWLGIPTSDQPPNHYRLLGLQDFESDSERIVTAANQRMTAIRQRYGKKDPEGVKSLVYELGLAMVCLQNPKTRAVYDQQLKAARVARTAQPVGQGAAWPEDSGPQFSTSLDGFDSFSPVARQSQIPVLPIGRKSKSSVGPTAIGLIGSAVIAFVSLVVAVYVVMPALLEKSHPQAVASPVLKTEQLAAVDRPPIMRQSRPRMNREASTPAQPAAVPSPIKSDSQPAEVQQPEAIAIKPRLPENWIVELPSGDFLDKARLEDATSVDFKSLADAGDAMFIASDPNRGPVAAFTYDDGRLSGPAVMVLRESQLRVKTQFDSGQRTGLLVIFDDANDFIVVARFDRGHRVRGTFLLKNCEPVLAQDWATNGKATEFLISGDELAPKDSLQPEEESARVALHDRLEAIERAHETAERAWKIAAFRWWNKNNAEIAKIKKKPLKADEIKTAIDQYIGKARTESNAGLSKVAALFNSNGG